MKKEVFLAVFVGFILGLIITFGIWTANKTLNQKPPQPSPTPAVDVTPIPAPATSQISLSITSPEDESIASTNTVTISGKTGANLPVAIAWESGQTIVIADESGNFETEIKLEGGYNRIIVTVTDASGNSAAKELLVTYTTSKI